MDGTAHSYRTSDGSSDERCRRCHKPGASNKPMEEVSKDCKRKVSSENKNTQVKAKQSF